MSDEAGLVANTTDIARRVEIWITWPAADRASSEPERGRSYQRATPSPCRVRHGLLDGERTACRSVHAEPRRSRSTPQPGLGEAVREARLARDLTQEDAAHACGVSTTWYARIESGKRDPKWGTIRKLAKGFGISMAELAERADALEPQRRP